MSLLRINLFRLKVGQFWVRQSVFWSGTHFGPEHTYGGHITLILADMLYIWLIYRSELHIFPIFSYEPEHSLRWSDRTLLAQPKGDQTFADRAQTVERPAWQSVFLWVFAQKLYKLDIHPSFFCSIVALWRVILDLLLKISAINLNCIFLFILFCFISSTDASVWHGRFSP